MLVVLLASLLAISGATPAPEISLNPVGSNPINPNQGTKPPAGFNITSIGVNGSGCPPNSAVYVLGADKTSVTITFSQYGAEAGPGLPISGSRKNCQVTLGVGTPPGFTFGVATIDYRGYYQLDTGVTASQNAIYYFQGNITQATARSELKGPVDGKEYTYRDSFDLASTVLSPCGVPSVLNINSDLRVSNTANNKGSGFITNDSIDASLKTTLNFVWQTCTKK